MILPSLLLPELKLQNSLIIFLALQISWGTFFLSDFCYFKVFHSNNTINSPLLQSLRRTKSSQKLLWQFWTDLFSKLEATTASHLQFSSLQKGRSKWKRLHGFEVIPVSICYLIKQNSTTCQCCLEAERESGSPFGQESPVAAPHICFYIGGAAKSCHPSVKSDSVNMSSRVPAELQKTVDSSSEKSQGG